VRGEPEPIAAAPSSPSNTTSLSSATTSSMAAIEPGVASLGAEEGLGEGSENGLNGNAGKRPAWNKPSNGPGPEVGPVMGGAVSWPALSESTRASAKLPSESLKGLSDIGSPVAISQVWFVKFL
jgi:la-related protein 1